MATATEKKQPPRPAQEARRRRFAEEYAKDGNGTQAAIRAGYSPNGAHVAAVRLLRDATVCALVVEARAMLSATAMRTAAEIDREAARVGFRDVRKLFNAEGQLLPPHQWPDDIAAVVSSVEVVTRRIPGGDAEDVEYVTKIRCDSKTAGLDLLAKMRGLVKNHIVREDPMKVIDVDSLTDAELVQWNTLIEKAMGARAPKP